jgi:hypothetical protein
MNKVGRVNLNRGVRIPRPSGHRESTVFPEFETPAHTVLCHFAVRILVCLWTAGYVSAAYFPGVVGPLNLVSLLNARTIVLAT